MARFKPVSSAQTLMVPIILEKHLVTGSLEFAMRGKVKVNIQWLLYCIVHNIRKIGGYGI